MRLPDWLDLPAASVRRKVRRMSPEQMGMWVDASGTDMSRAFATYVRTRDEVHLQEFERGLAVLVAMNQELRARRD